MELEQQSSLEVPSSRGVPDEEREKVTAQIEEHVQEDVRAGRKTAEQVERIGEGHRDRLRDRVGKETYDKLRADMNEVKAEERRRLQPPAGPDMGPEGQEQLKRWRLNHGEAILRRMRVDPRALREESMVTRDKLADVLPQPKKSEGAQLLGGEEPPHELAGAQILAAGAEPAAAAFSSIGPPYPGWAWNNYWYTDGFSWTGSLVLDSAAGLAGSVNNLRDSSASDFDYGWGEYNSSVGFWYRMPTAGLVEVWVKGQCAAAHHHLSLYDEWGWSDSWVYQYDYLTLKTSGASTSSLITQQMSWFYEDGYTSGYWDRHYLTAGGVYWAHLYSDVSYPAGTWVYVQVGNRTTNSAFANDVSVYSTADFRWFLPQVMVRSTG
jgi:hypothetical protein